MFRLLESISLKDFFCNQNKKMDFTTIVATLRLRTASKVKESSVLRPRIDIIRHSVALTESRCVTALRSRFFSMSAVQPLGLFGIWYYILCTTTTVPRSGGINSLGLFLMLGQVETYTN